VSFVAALRNENHCFLPSVASIHLMHKPSAMCSDFGKQETGTKLTEGMYMFFKLMALRELLQFETSI